MSQNNEVQRYEEILHFIDVRKLRMGNDVFVSRQVASGSEAKISSSTSTVAKLEIGTESPHSERSGVNAPTQL